MEEKEVRFKPWTASDCLEYGCAFAIQMKDDKHGNKRCHCLNKELAGLFFKGPCTRKKKHFKEKHHVSIPNLEK